MTIENGHFRSDGKTIEPCCVILKYEINCHFKIRPQNKDEFRIWLIDDINTPIFKIRCCPFCGAKLEYVEELEASQ